MTRKPSTSYWRRCSVVSRTILHASASSGDTAGAGREPSSRPLPVSLDTHDAILKYPVHRLELPVVLIPSWEQPGAGNLSDKLGASWEPVIGSNAGARSLGAPGSLGAPPKNSLGAPGSLGAPPQNSLGAKKNSLAQARDNPGAAYWYIDH